MDPLVTNWNSGGNPYTLTTNPIEGETRAQFEARHAEFLEVLQAPGNYPPD